MNFKNFNLYPYQQVGVQTIVDWYNRNETRRLCLAAPTGSGKSIVELAAMDAIPNMWLLTPRIEIIDGMLKKLGYGTTGWSDSTILSVGWGHRISTPITFRNQLAYTGLDIEDACLIYDEGHHHNADTYKEIELLLGGPRAVCVTASPYRGTPKGTKVFKDTWGDPVWLITYPQAILSKIITMPSVQTIPLVDDDLVTIVNGEFQVESMTSMYSTRLQEIADMAVKWTDKPTMFSLPSLELCNQLKTLMKVPCEIVYDKTPRKLRRSIFEKVVKNELMLIQMNVVSEGVDLPIRRLVDLACTMSPVKWIQQFGRITRPGGLSEYICTNRNFLRHAYLLDGCYPISSYLEAQQAFPLSNRSGVRAIGLEALGKFKPTNFHLDNGLIGTIYQVQTSENNVTVKYAAIVHPAKTHVVWVRQENQKLGYDGQKVVVNYGDWKPCNPPDGLQGFASTPVKALTEKQLNWWTRTAKKHGLDPTKPPDSKAFAILPILSQLKARL